ncbi:putative dihydroxyacetone kinase 1 [Pseudohyphozyma bogoriensis]|nr:putative dihydroxyacetone kinase 1 [Pseudohyphozyma bogoriensis]
MSATKHIINDPRELVNESLRGLGRLNPALAVDETNRVVKLATIPKDRVALISGGGSGHEPSHAGFVGEGLLSAAICGNVFASPNVGQIRKAIDLVDNNKGTLAIIMRYTGDVLLFGLAKEQHAVTNPDKPFRLTVVGDDCAVPRKQGSLVGRRGLAGTVLVYKIASALADEGADIEKCYEIAEYVATRVGTMGAGLDHCHIPGTGVAEAHLGADEVELGMGIHNEAGVLREKITSSKALITKMLSFITNTKDEERAFLPYKHDGKDEVILLVNNLGGISELEMSSIANDAVDILAEQGITVKRIIVGSVMTSLNLPGFSLTTLLLPRAGEPYTSDRIIELFDAPASSPGWKFAAKGVPGVPSAPAAVAEPPVIKSGGAPVPYDAAFFEKAVIAAAEAVIKAEPEITKYDTIAGDGDCGLCLKSGGEGIIAAFKEGKVDKQDVVTAVLNLAQSIEKSMDGTSGALYSIWSNALAAGLSKAAKESGAKSADAAVWAAALEHALSVLYTYTAARRPSRTLVDPLDAFTAAFGASKGKDFAGAVKEAEAASEKTKDLVAKAGRAAYVGQEELAKAQVPDPGAHGVATLLGGIHVYAPPPPPRLLLPSIGSHWDDEQDLLLTTRLAYVAEGISDLEATTTDRTLTITCKPSARAHRFVKSCPEDAPILVAQKRPEQVDLCGDEKGEVWKDVWEVEAVTDPRQHKAHASRGASEMPEKSGILVLKPGDVVRERALTLIEGALLADDAIQLGNWLDVEFDPVRQKTTMACSRSECGLKVVFREKWKKRGRSVQKRWKVAKVVPRHERSCSTTTRSDKKTKPWETLTNVFPSIVLRSSPESTPPAPSSPAHDPIPVEYDHLLSDDALFPDPPDPAQASPLISPPHTLPEVPSPFCPLPPSSSSSTFFPSTPLSPSHSPQSPPIPPPLSPTTNPARSQLTQYFSGVLKQFGPQIAPPYARTGSSKTLHDFVDAVIEHRPGTGNVVDAFETLFIHEGEGKWGETLGEVWESEIGRRVRSAMRFKVGRECDAETREGEEVEESESEMEEDQKPEVEEDEVEDMEEEGREEIAETPELEDTTMDELQSD